MKRLSSSCFATMVLYMLQFQKSVSDNVNKAAFWKGSKEKERGCLKREAHTSQANPPQLISCGNIISAHRIDMIH
jgi:hypothetical protein